MELAAIVCGGRNWKDSKMIREVLQSLPKRTLIIHGAARGADTIAGKIAKDEGLKVKAFPAEWERYGKGAGPIRNIEMMECLRNTGARQKMVIAFHDDINASKGTKHMVTVAKEEGIPVQLYSSMSIPGSEVN